MTRIATATVVGSVLIETLWNVKWFYVLRIPFLYGVLIETLWNVKAVADPWGVIPLGFNRNIVECKVDDAIPEP